jgi:hypothetical protein
MGERLPFKNIYITDVLDSGEESTGACEVE